MIRGMADDTAIEFVATVSKVSTLADGGLRLTLDLPETAIAQSALMMECKRLGLVLDVTCRTTNSKQHADDLGAMLDE